MRKIILLVIGLSFWGLSNFNAQSLAGHRFYINPGHGGHDSNDRNMPEANFWESESNLSKGLYLKSILESLGATVFMSRTTNTTADDLPLSQIAEGANANNVDYFHSIHSNAYNGARNYTLILFQGRTSAPTYSGSLTMANYLANEIYKVNRTVSKTVAGDFDFYGTGQAYLGVFKGLNMPGTLSEGSFHDYLPETWRLKNDGYLKHEAWAIARSFLLYYNGGSFPNGIVAGIVRDELETVPSSYQPLAGTLDRYKPLNQIQVRMEPGGKIYNGDSFNNGYYFFDNVVPGNYTLYFDYEKMKTDTVSVVVKANESVFVDRLMILNPILDPPVILNFSPSDSLNEVSNISNIVFEFDIRMNTQATENAISISPTVAGSFKWENDYKKVTFTPTKSYVSGSKYTVTIATSAKTHFGINLPQPKTFSFTTRSKLNLVATYPVSNMSDISTSVFIRLQFDKGISASTLANKITLTDSNGNGVLVQANQSKYNIGIIDFEPKSPLNNNALYRITLKAGIGDVEYVTMPRDTIIQFTTEKNYQFTGNILEGFETSNVWQSPLLSSNTTGVNNSLTSFVIYNLRKKSGSNSGKLEYGFSGNSGLVEVSLLSPIELGESSAEGFGIWVFGDNSKNILKYRFSRNNSSDENIEIDTLDWTGWKLKKIWLNEIPGTGPIQFKSINVVQSGIGETTGKIYFDECVSNIITDVKTVDNDLPAEFRLEQNYPNPFNPSTTIKYSIPVYNSGKAVQITLKIFDLLGREVITLVNENKNPGNYEVTFNANGLASGIYIYKIQAGNFIDTKKLVLLK